MNNYSKYLCIFGGGAVRGYSYLGVLKAFEEVGFYPEKLAGSSVGSIFATLYSLDVSIKDMEKCFNDVNFELFKDINFSFAPTFSISKGGVFLEWLRELIEKNFYKEEYKKGKNNPVCFKDLNKDLIIIATDLSTGLPFIFSKNLTPDYEIAMAIRASASLPGLLTPIHYEDKILADGDLLKSNPLWRLHKELCPENFKVLELRLEGIKQHKNIKTLIDYLNQIQSCITNYSTDYIIDMYSNKDKFDYIKIDTKDLLLVNFNLNAETKKELETIGYDAAIQHFKINLPQKQLSLLKKYRTINEFIENFEFSITKDKLNQAKSDLLHIATLAANSKQVIGKKYYEELISLNKLFLDNLTKGFLGKEKLKDKKELLTKLEKIKSILKKKLTELTK